MPDAKKNDMVLETASANSHSKGDGDDIGDGYTIVQFTHDKSVVPVPESWVQQEGKTSVCYWPISSPMKHVERRSAVDKEKWPCYRNFNIFGKAKSYQTAMSMTNEVALSSSFNADDDARWTKKRPRLSSSSDDEYDLEDKVAGQNSIQENFCYDSLTSESIESRQPSDPIIIPEEIKYPDCKGLQEEVLSLLHKIIENQASSQKSFESLNESPQEDVVCQAKSLAELHTILRRIQTLPNYRQKLISYLANIGGKNTGDTVRNIMSRVATPEVWQLFSFKGQRGKKRFETSPICDIIIKAVMNHEAGKCTEQKVTVAISDVLRYAKKRTKSLEMGDESTAIKFTHVNPVVPVPENCLKQEVNESERNVSYGAASSIAEDIERSTANKENWQHHRDFRTAQTNETAVSNKNGGAETYSEANDNDGRNIHIFISSSTDDEDDCRDGQKTQNASQANCNDSLTSESAALREPPSPCTIPEEIQCDHCGDFPMEVISLLHKILENQRTSLKTSEDLVQSLQEDIVRQAKSSGDLEEILQHIQTEPNYKEKLISYLANIGGRNPGDTVRNIMSRIATPDIWQLFSFKGQRGKTRFDTSPLCEIIIKATMKHEDGDDCTEQKVAVAIADVLRYAKRKSQKRTLSEAGLDLDTFGVS